MTRNVLEIDLRKPEFRDANIDDLEFRSDGKIVRKDRWEMGIRSIAFSLIGTKVGFEIDDIVEKVRDLISSDSKNVINKPKINRFI